MPTMHSSRLKMEMNDVCTAENHRLKTTPTLQECDFVTFLDGISECWESAER